jgi:hypothetical protein
MKPGETTFVSWRKLVKDSHKAACSTPLGAHPALHARIAPSEVSTLSWFQLIPSASEMHDMGLSLLPLATVWSIQPIIMLVLENFPGLTAIDVMKLPLQIADKNPPSKWIKGRHKCDPFFAMKRKFCIDEYPNC